MKILQLHADYIEYEPVSREGPIAEEAEKKKILLKDILVLFTTIEETDTEAIASKMIDEIKEFTNNLGINKILIYPYAHLSNKLARPEKALKIIKHMEDVAKKMGLDVHRSPFGWNKRFTISIKGHPLAEQFRSDVQLEKKSVQKQVLQKPAEVTTRIEAKEPTHVFLGRELDIFSINPTAGSGLPLYHPRGAIIREELIKLIREINQSLGFQEVWTPHLFRSELWYKTGHYEAYRERMFVLDVEDEEYVVKPMNCPGHALIYMSRPRSYRDLPIAYSEFATVYRNEQSGELTGLLRVRALTQDDGHVFCRVDQIKDQVTKIMKAALTIHQNLIGGNVVVNLSTRPEKFIGSVELWDYATEMLKNSLEELQINYVLKEGEGAFYGPKIDIDVEDSLGRKWQCTTIQLDFFIPENLGLEYVDADGTKKRPVIIHRALLGSLDRYIALLLEHYNGRLPVWLSPEQVRIITVSDRVASYAEKVRDILLSKGIRCSLSLTEGTVSKKILQAHSDRVSFIVIIGDNEEKEGVISVRDATGKTYSGIKPEEFGEWVKRLIDLRSRNVGIYE
ncbi:MAG: threonine--tRNA ligase [Nitrososphaerota archaeon]